jgi:M6 family metalloprotease-like protein
MKHLLLAIIFLFGFYGCGGGGSSSGVSVSPPSKKIAFFYDSVVDGLEYTWEDCSDADIFNNNSDAPHYTGVPNGSGSFYFQNGCSVKFKIGKIILGDIGSNDIVENGKIFPTNILGLATTNTADTRVANLLRIIQSLDNDNDPRNGIIISQSIRDNLSASSVKALNIKANTTITESDLNATVLSADSTKTLVSISAARSHFDRTLQEHVDPNLDTTKPATPFLIDKSNQNTTLTQIKTFHTKERKVKIYGESGTKILKAVNHTGFVTNLNFSDTSLVMKDDWTQEVPLTFDNNDEKNFHKFIVLQDASGKKSDILHLNVIKDFVPPHVQDSTVSDKIFEEQIYFRNINASDSSQIKFYQIVAEVKDDRSLDDEQFQVDTAGNVTFKTPPDYDDPSGQKDFQLVARAIDDVGNMTDVLLKVSLKNLLDHPPVLKDNQSDFNTTLIEKPAPSAFVADLNLTLEDNLTIAPDNNITISDYFHFKLLSHTEIFEVNLTTGIVTVKDENNLSLDYEHCEKPDTDSCIIPVSFSVENNDTNQEGNPNSPNVTTGTLHVEITNKLDTKPSILPEIIDAIYEQHDNYNHLDGFVFSTIDKNLSASDRDFIDYDFNFTIISPIDNNFSIGPQTGKLKVVTELASENHIDGVSRNPSINYVSTLDYETIPEYNLTIRATNYFDDNSDGDYNDTNNKILHSDEINVTIKLLNVIDNIPKIKHSVVLPSFLESISSEQIIAIVDANGTNIDENNITQIKFYRYTRAIDNEEMYNVVVGSEDPRYKNDTNRIPLKKVDVNATRTNIVTTRSFLADEDFLEDINGSASDYTLTLRAQNIWWDGTTHESHDSSGENIIFNVANVIDNPPKLKIQPTDVFEVNETVAHDGSYIIHTVEHNASIFDEKNITRFEIVGSKYYFDINTSTGQIYVAQDLDWETQTEDYTLYFQAVNTHWDGKEYNSTTKFINISIENIIEDPPIITGPTEITIHENISANELLAILETTKSTERNVTDQKTITGFSIVSGNDGNFTISNPIINEVTQLPIGKLETNTSVSLDYESNKTVYNLEINATNDSGKFTTHSIKINILDDIETDMPLVIIPIEYDDINLTVSDTDLYNLIFRGHYGDLNHYFEHVSQKKFKFKKVDENRGNNDGVIRVKLSGENHPESDPFNLNNHLRMALYDVNSSLDFSDFDKNSDGNVTKDELQIVFIIAGGEISYGDSNKSIQANVGTFSSIELMDGVKVAYDFSNNFDPSKDLTFEKEDGNYVVVGELNNGNPASFGLIAHHLGHTALNFPYLLDTKYQYNGIGYLGLMGYGYRGYIEGENNGTTPVNISAYNIISQGWVHPRTITSTTELVQLIASNKGSDGYNIIKIPIDTGNNPKNYYLLENRAITTGSGYDDGFYGMEDQNFTGGIVLWKINENQTNNNDINNKLVDFVEYDNDTGLDAKPGTAQSHYGKSSSIFKGLPTYSNIADFSITYSSITEGDNNMTIDITIP